MYYAARMSKKPDVASVLVRFPMEVDRDDWVSDDPRNRVVTEAPDDVDRFRPQEFEGGGRFISGEVRMIYEGEKPPIAAIPVSGD